MQGRVRQISCISLCFQCCFLYTIMTAKKKKSGSVVKGAVIINLKVSRPAGQEREMDELPVLAQLLQT